MRIQIFSCVPCAKINCAIIVELTANAMTVRFTAFFDNPSSVVNAAAGLKLSYFDGDVFLEA